MKVFKVITEQCAGDSKEIITTQQFVTADSNELITVTEWFTDHCEQYEKDLKGVLEVLVITQNIK